MDNLRFANSSEVTLVQLLKERPTNFEQLDSCLSVTNFVANNSSGLLPQMRREGVRGREDGHRLGELSEL